jgi:hypothetical protein
MIPVDRTQYTPLTAVQIIFHFNELRDRILTLERLIDDIVKANGLLTQTKRKRAPAMAKKPKHDDVAEDKAMINASMAKHVKKDHPGETPTKIKRGGAAKANKGRKR